MLALAIKMNLFEVIAISAVGIFTLVVIGVMIIHGIYDLIQDDRRIGREIALREQQEAYRIKNPVAYRKEKIHWAKTPYKYSYRFDNPMEAYKAQTLLQSMADGFMHLFDDMPPVRVLVIDEPIHSGRPSLALGGGGFVYFKYEHFINDRHHELQKTLKHELVHNWIWWKGIKVDDPHGPEFQQKLESIL